TREQLLTQWGGYLFKAATAGYLTGKPVAIEHFRRIAGPRAGALEMAAGLDSGALVRALSRDNAALLRQFVPWAFQGQPLTYMSGRYVRVEAGWSDDLAETMIRLADLGQHPDPTSGRWIVGKNEHGVTIIPGLNDQTPHWLVSGTTGSGKSVALRSAVLQLSRDPANRLVLLDGKFGESLRQVQHLPGVAGPVATEGPDVRAALGWACAQMRERYRVGSADASPRPGRVVVVFDEFQQLTGDAVVVDLLRKLAEQGRAAGVHLLAATQHPTVDAFGDPSTRRNLVGKLALRVGDPDASRVAVGGRLPRADYLLGAGDAYAVGPGKLHRIQCAFVDGRDIDQAGAGAWDFDTWPDYAASDVGLDIPTGVSKPYTAQELGCALVAAYEGEGRPTFMRRMGVAGLPSTGSNRAYRLHKFGQEVLAWLDGQEYGLSYLGG
ncbi:MAG: hypothetical protein KJ734_07760, partial [Chloroflexi bacterium]|nr:hypothetical protein [Chloroflexota bacterium]